ncbi:metallophosphoesterase [Luteipulveratus halotolerans]|uniref:Membrane protein n=1 Tax=Luteipulveratus halotolerans TaxID=1631356 RepID=A0A0L6CEF3_9MICO|nr:metallophosphoesterase [Luteipulveratus halotolerans]KNX36059.1 membrane protein [Luteipulveratus halotolerans]
MRLRTPLALAAAAATAVSLAAPSYAAGNGSQHDYTMAIIGDVPYGAEQIEKFPAWIDEINADPDVRFDVHLGDIKNGSTRCDTSYFQWVKSEFDRFSDPLVYTPGDNEWTDCHRANNGAYNPLDRLATVRDTFFSKTDQTNGRPQHVDTQASIGLPENAAFSRNGVEFAAVHVVGSNNDMAPWTGIGKTTPTAEQTTEQASRMAASITWVRQAFDRAKSTHGRAVVLMMQADMFDPTYDVPRENNSSFDPLVREIASQTKAFGKPVYLLNGDSHIYDSDNPLAPGSKWLSFYGLTEGVTNFHRVTVDGSDNNKDWLKLTVTGASEPTPLSWERIPYQH